MYIFLFFSHSEMVAAGVITTEQDLIASLLSESLAELSAALSPEKVTLPHICNISDIKLCKTFVSSCYPNIFFFFFFFLKDWWHAATVFIYFYIIRVEGLLWGAEPRFELGPAVQQAGALLSEPHRTLNILQSN
jgi:hypothetical protein